MTKQQETKLLPVKSEDAVLLAAQLLKNGNVVGMPTETVYGLAANALDESAVKEIFNAKGRPQDNPLIVHIAGLKMLEGLVTNVPPQAYKLAEAFWPGPLTMVLPKTGKTANAVSAGLGTIGVRWPAHKGAQAIIKAAGLPLAAPSANISGRPSPTSAHHVMQDMNGRIPLILDGGQSLVGVESTVITFLPEIAILRPGFVTQGEIEDVLGEPVKIAPSAQRELEKGEAAESPGMKYKHYSPNAEIFLIDSNSEQYVEFINKLKDTSDVFALCYNDDTENIKGVPCISFGERHCLQSQASGLFSALRQLDEAGAKTAYAPLPAEEGVGLAVRNRLLRAAAFNVIHI